MLVDLFPRTVKAGPSPRKSENANLPSVGSGLACVTASGSLNIMAGFRSELIPLDLSHEQSFLGALANRTMNAKAELIKN